MSHIGPATWLQRYKNIRGNISKSTFPNFASHKENVAVNV